MTTIKSMCLVISLLLLSSISEAQLKYVGENKGVTVFTASFSESGMTNGVGGEIDFSINGKVGFGGFYSHTNNPGSSIFGIQCEIPLYRPVNKLAVGFNLLGAAGLSVFSVKSEELYYVSNTGPVYKTVENSFSGQFGVLGAEVYLNVPGNKSKIEPFVQFSITFSKLSDYNVSSTKSSFALGADVFLLKLSRNNLILTPGILFAENTKNSLELNLTFIHAFN